MKRAAVIFCALCCIAAAPEWKSIGATLIERIYVTTKAPTRGAHGTVRSWEKEQQRIDTPEGREERAANVTRITGAGVTKEKAETFEHIITEREFDCAGERDRILQAIYRDAKDNPIYSLTADDIKEGKFDEWQTVVPGSIGEAVLERVCTDAEIAPGVEQ